MKFQVLSWRTLRRVLGVFLFKLYTSNFRRAAGGTARTNKANLPGMAYQTAPRKIFYRLIFFVLTSTIDRSTLCRSSKEWPS